MIKLCVSIGALAVMLHAIPRFLSPGEQIVSVKEGETARLTCAYDGLEEGHAVMWKRDTEEGSVLFIDTDALTEDGRIKLDTHEHALIIELAEPADSGDYLCTITSDPQITIRRTLKVHVPPSVNMVPEQSTLILKPSEPFLQLTCYGSGNPLPQIVWRKLDGSLPGGNSSRLGQTLSYSTSEYNVDDMEGQYECIASNGVEPPASKRIKVVIHFKPVVKASKTLYIQKLGDSVNISCEFSAKPQAQVAWYHNGYPVRLNEPGYKVYGSEEDEWESSYLNIRQLESKNLGDYECKIHNEMGAGKSDIHLTTLPGPVKLMQESDNGLRAVSLRWDFESPVPPTKYKVEYRERGTSDQWIEKYVDPDPSALIPNGKRFEMKYLLEGLEPGTQYEVRVVAANEHGFGSLPDASLVIKTIGTGKQSTSKSKSKSSTNTEPPSETKGGAELRAIALPTLLIGYLATFLFFRTVSS